MSGVPSEVEWLRPGHVAERAGVAVSTLHYYESVGLISSRRTAGGRREYRRDVLRVIAFVRASQRVGISLERIRAALERLPVDAPPTKREWATISRLWHDDLNARIEELVALRDHFSDCIACGCLSLRSCPVVNPGDVYGREGPGARGLPGARGR